jgi:hypothetical protein
MAHEARERAIRKNRVEIEQAAAQKESDLQKKGQVRIAALHRKALEGLAFAEKEQERLTAKRTQFEERQRKALEF